MSEPEPDPDGPHNLPPSQQIRCTLIGTRLNGEPCTVVLIRDQERHGWVLYPHGLAKMGVRITDQAATEAAQCLLHRGAS